MPSLREECLRQALGLYIREKYPELSGYNDSDFRIDAICERDGIDGVRLLRRREPSERAPRKKPRWR